MTKREIYEEIYNFFDAPCGYGWFDMSKHDEWCEEHCKKHTLGNWECWEKYFEG